MSIKNPKILVIDASIAGSAGDKDKTHPPESTICRDFLEEVRVLGHKVVMTPAIVDEWNHNGSRFAHQWRSIMARKGRIVWLSEKAVLDDELRSQIKAHAPSETIYQIVIKDVLLIEAALATTSPIAARDDKARNHYKTICDKITTLEGIIWVNPLENNLVIWLRENAPAKDEYLLCYTKPE